MCKHAAANHVMGWSLFEEEGLILRALPPSHCDTNIYILGEKESENKDRSMLRVVSLSLAQVSAHSQMA